MDAFRLAVVASILSCYFQHVAGGGGNEDAKGSWPSASARVKRQQQSQQEEPADQFINNIFQIPIQTLSAVNELVKSTRPVIQRARERIQQQYQSWQQQQPQQQQPQTKMQQKRTASKHDRPQYN